MQQLTRSAARYVSKLANKVRRRIDSFSNKEDFSGAQGKALHFILAQTDDIFQKDIEEEYGLRPPTASELLKKMEKKGLIHRETVAYDARLKKITASEKAMRYKDQVVHDLLHLEQSLTKDIAPEDMETFFRVMEKMLDNLS